MQCGAQHVINSAKTPVHDELQQLTRGMGPDVVIEAIGLPATYRMAIEEVAFTGRVVYVGYAKEPVAYETRLFVQKELDIMGSRNALDEFPSVIAMLEQGKFPVDKIISATASLLDAGKVLREWDERPQAFTKILIEVS
jgi:threonine dehydrogenase-like Zn-dependent dehydrogenase